jgi:hypothetical protein
MNITEIADLFGIYYQTAKRYIRAIEKSGVVNRYTLEFLGTWETIHNPNFKVVEFDRFKTQAGLPIFVMSVSKWIEKTNAIGIIVQKGR